MKLRRIFAAAGVALVLGGFASCSNDTKPISQADLAGASQTDSLMYWLGQVNAMEYLTQAQRDTVLQSPEARKEFLRGLRAGLEAVRDMDAYNTGVWQGVQMAINLRELSKEYPDMKFSDAIMTRSMAEALASDSIAPATGAEAQANFQRIFASLEAQKSERERAAAITALPAEAKKLGMTEVAPHLYAKTLTQGNGTKFNTGDKVPVSITVRKTDGTRISLPFPTEVQIGARYLRPVVSDALATMTMDGVSTFATSAYELFGKRCDSRDLKPTDVLIIDIKTGEPAKKDQADTKAAIEQTKAADAPAAPEEVKPGSRR